MNDTKLLEVYNKLLDTDTRLSVLQCLDIEMSSFNPADFNSARTVLAGVSLLVSDFRSDISQVLEMFNL